MAAPGSDRRRRRRVALAIGVLLLPFGPVLRASSTSHDEGAPLIELGLTTNRSNTASGSGGFWAHVLARSGLVDVLYDCSSAVEAQAKQWAAKQRVRLMERKDELERLRLVYSSDKPAGQFILEYRISPSRRAVRDVRVSFVFRTLTNVMLPGDDAGLEGLGHDLFKAVQCVP